MIIAGKGKNGLVVFINFNNYVLGRAGLGGGKSGERARGAFSGSSMICCFFIFFFGFKICPRPSILDIQKDCPFFINIVHNILSGFKGTWGWLCSLHSSLKVLTCACDLITRVMAGWNILVLLFPKVLCPSLNCISWTENLFLIWYWFSHFCSLFLNEVCL